MRVCVCVWVGVCTCIPYIIRMYAKETNSLDESAHRIQEDTVIIIDHDDGDEELQMELPPADVGRGGRGMHSLQKRVRERAGRCAGVASGTDRSRSAEARYKQRKTGKETADGKGKKEAGKEEAGKEEAGKEAGKEMAAKEVARKELENVSASGKKTSEGRPAALACTWHVELWRKRLATGVCCACVWQTGRDSLAMTDL